MTFLDSAKKTSATGQIATLKSGETDTSREIGTEIRLPRAEFIKAINLWEQINGDYAKMLNTE